MQSTVTEDTAGTEGPRRAGWGDPPTEPPGGAGPPTPPTGPGAVPGLALPPSTELLHRLRAGQGVAVAVLHLDAVVAHTRGVGGHDPWVEGREGPVSHRGACRPPGCSEHGRLVDLDGKDSNQSQAVTGELRGDSYVDPNSLSAVSKV